MDKHEVDLIKGYGVDYETLEEVLEAVEEESNFKCLYEDELSLKEKIETIAREIYGADGVTYDKEAEKTIAELEKLGFGNMPVCMAKNQYSLSDDPTKLGRPSGFTVNIREVYVSAGAGLSLSGYSRTCGILEEQTAELKRSFSWGSSQSREQTRISCIS